LVEVSLFEIQRGPTKKGQKIFSITRSKDSFNDSFKQPARRTITFCHSFSRGCILFVWWQRTNKTMPLW